MTETKNSCIKIKHLLAVLGILATILIAIFSYVFSGMAAVESKYDTCREGLKNIENQLSALQVHIVYIKQAIDNNK